MRPYNALRSNTLGWICYAVSSGSLTETTFHESEEAAVAYGDDLLDDEGTTLVVVAQVKREGGAV